MTKKGVRKSQSQDELAKELFTESKTNNEETPQKISTKKTPKSAKKRKFDQKSDTENMGELTSGLNQEVTVPTAETTMETPKLMKKTPKTKTPKTKTPKTKTPKTKTPSKEAGEKNKDDEVTFNFEARSAKKSLNSDSSSEKVRKAAGGEDGKDSEEMSQPSDVVMETTTPAPETEDVPMETKEAVAKVPLSERNLVKRPTSIKARSKKRKLSKQKKGVSALENDEDDTNGIVFYCGNLPPGNTKETLTMFLEEEGIHPKISLSTVKKWDTKDFMAKLTPKQRSHKKNMMRAAKAHFATIIVKTEEEAKKLLDLQGISMPAPIRNDWSTNLKIIRRLPKIKNLPYKVHIGGLHKEVVEDELKTYLESRGVKPGKVVVIRRHKTNESKRYGFVWFESVKEADRAVDLPEPTLREKPVKIQHSFKKKFKNF
ncbi:uncharacterized protein [Asterias amurensis]|uniref:uncharacterized protein n=1 Tax=Asterias amurensis TaxID=7602 RepID=UPI003AB415A6